jgi:hypothetical protein
VEAANESERPDLFLSGFRAHCQASDVERQMPVRAQRRVCAGHRERTSVAPPRLLQQRNVAATRGRFSGIGVISSAERRWPLSVSRLPAQWIVLAVRAALLTALGASAEDDAEMLVRQEEQVPASHGHGTPTFRTDDS